MVTDSSIPTSSQCCSNHGVPTNQVFTFLGFSVFLEGFGYSIMFGADSHLLRCHVSMVSYGRIRSSQDESLHNITKTYRNNGKLSSRHQRLLQNISATSSVEPLYAPSQVHCIGGWRNGGCAATYALLSTASHLCMLPNGVEPALTGFGHQFVICCKQR